MEGAVLLYWLMLLLEWVLLLILLWKWRVLKVRIFWVRPLKVAKLMWIVSFEERLVVGMESVVEVLASFSESFG
jgi:hypothetical protein